jgi:hypothetical protein
MPVDDLIKDKYRYLCEKETTISIFCKDWWLDSVCGKDNWNAIIVEKGQDIIGAMPYYLTKGFFGLSQIMMPKLTQYNGIWIKYQNNQDHNRKLSYEKEVMNAVIEQIDSIGLASFNQHFHHSVTNWLPFFWKGFQQTTRYTYVLEDLTDLNKIYNNFERDKRAWIKKSSKSLIIKYDISSQDFYKIHRQALAKQGLEINYSFKLFDDIYRTVYDHDQGKTIYCEDAQGNVLGGLFILWDENSANFLISAYDPEYRNNGLGSLLTWEAIKYVSSHTQKCDFTGSIVESYERSYRAFGGIQKPYFNIRKTYSPLYLIQDGIRQVNSGVRAGIKNVFSKGIDHYTKQNEACELKYNSRLPQLKPKSSNINLHRLDSR